MNDATRFAARIRSAGFENSAMDTGKEIFIYPETIAFLAPPLDTIPSPHGNAIYTIVEEYAALYPEPCIVIAAWPVNGTPAQCAISDRIFYCRQPFQKFPFEEALPHCLKRFVWGTGRPEILHYARQAANLCQMLQIKTIIVEDVPTYAWLIRQKMATQPTIILHQHANAPKSYSAIWWNRIERSLDGIILVAEQTRRETQKFHRPLRIPSAIVYNGVDLNEYSPEKWETAGRTLREDLGITPDEVVMLFIGRMIPGKGPLEAVEAFLKADVPNTRFLLVGPLSGNLYEDAAYLQRLKDTTAASQGKAILAGPVGQAALPAYYAAVDLVIVPSIQKEGLPKVITEALAMGKPVLASDRGGTLELIRPGENGWIIQDPANIPGSSAQLRALLSNSDMLLIMKQVILRVDRPNRDIHTSVANLHTFVQSIQLSKRHSLRNP